MVLYLVKFWWHSKYLDVCFLFKRFYNWTVLIVVIENVFWWSWWVGDTNCEVKDACFKHELEFYALVVISKWSAWSLQLRRYLWNRMLVLFMRLFSAWCLGKLAIVIPVTVIWNLLELILTLNIPLNRLVYYNQAGNYTCDFFPYTFFSH